MRTPSNRSILRTVIALLLAFLFVWGALPESTAVTAQSAPGPIILNLTGDLWAWHGPDQPLEQLTSWGANYSPILSSDGTRVAYTSMAQVVRDWLREVGGGGGFSPPLNIWMLDIPSGQTYRIADQPADVVYAGPNQPGKYILRTEPSWSPDGTQLAWVEVLIDTLTTAAGASLGTGQLIIYDLNSGTTQSVEAWPITSEQRNYVWINVKWGPPGITLCVAPNVLTPSLEMRLYDPSGDTATRTFVDAQIPWSCGQAQWVSDQEQQYQFAHYEQNEWFDWDTGQAEPLSGPLEMVSRSAPDGVRAFLSNDTWHVEFPGQPPIDLGDDMTPYGISRDGQQVAYGRGQTNPETNQHARTLLVLSAGGVFDIGFIGNYYPVWGPVEWHIRQ